MAPPVGGPTSARRRRPRWLAVVFVLLLVVPILEIAAIIAVGKVIGGWQTLVLLVLESLLGAWLVRREGARAWAALTTALNTGRMPSRQLADAALVLVGGTLLLTPGFLTDIVGFFFILPMTRPLARRALEASSPGSSSGACSARGEGAAAQGRGPTSSRARSSDVLDYRSDVMCARRADGAPTAGCAAAAYGMTEGRAPVGDAAFRS